MTPGPRQPTGVSHQSLGEAGSLLSSWFPDLSVGGARLVSDQVLLFGKKKKKKGHLLRFLQKWSVGEMVLVRSMEANPVSETQWEGMALPPPFWSFLLLQAVLTHSL